MNSRITERYSKHYSSRVEGLERPGIKRNNDVSFLALPPEKQQEKSKNEMSYVVGDNERHFIKLPRKRGTPVITGSTLWHISLAQIKKPKNCSIGVSCHLKWLFSKTQTHKFTLYNQFPFGCKGCVQQGVFRNKNTQTFCYKSLVPCFLENLNGTYIRTFYFMQIFKHCNAMNARTNDTQSFFHLPCTLIPDFQSNKPLDFLVKKNKLPLSTMLK